MRRVLVRPVARVYHAARHRAGQQIRGSGGGIYLEVAAAVSIVVCGLYYLFLRVYFEPTTEDLFRARIASHLLPLVSLAGMLLVLGIVESYGTIFIGAWLNRDAIAFLALIALLMVRPQGFTGTRTT